MEKNTTESKTCQDCKRFVLYCSILRDKLFHLHLGHCKERAMRRGTRRPDELACRHFIQRDMEGEKISRNNLFRDTITKMEKRLCEIAQILSLDDTNNNFE